jgi:hypothetical protein
MRSVFFLSSCHITNMTSWYPVQTTQKNKSITIIKVYKKADQPDHFIFPVKVCARWNGWWLARNCCRVIFRHLWYKAAAAQTISSLSLNPAPYTPTQTNNKMSTRKSIEYASPTKVSISSDPLTPAR